MSNRQRYLRDLRDPIIGFLDEVPQDDEELTTDEARAIDERLEAYRRGKQISSDEAKRELLD